MNQQIEIQAVFQKQNYTYGVEKSYLLQQNAARAIKDNLSQKFKVLNTFFFAMFQKTRHELTDDNLRKFLKLGQRDLVIHIELKNESKNETSAQFKMGQSMESPDESAFISEDDEPRTEKLA